MAVDKVARGLAAASAGVAALTAADRAATMLAVSLANVPVYPDTVYATALPRGISGTTITAGGTGGMNGTWPLAFSGGSITGMAGTFVVAGGSLVSINITNTGLGSGTTPPSLSFAASTGLTGAVATASVNTLVAQTKNYFALSADNLSLVAYSNNGTTTPAAVLNPDGTQVSLPTTGYLTSLLTAVRYLRDMRRTLPGVDAFLVDGNNNLLMGLDPLTGLPTGRLFEAKANARMPEVPIVVAVPAARDWKLIFVYGQSNSNGFASGSEINYGAGTGVALSTVQPYNNITFVGGPVTPVGAGKTDAIGPLIESTNTGIDAVNGSYYGESPCTAIATSIVERALERLGRNPSANIHFVCSPSHTAYTVAQLAKNTGSTGWWANAVTPFLQAIKTLATNANKTVSCPVVVMGQGEQDADQSTARATYITVYNQILADIRAEIMSTFGAWQTAAPHVVVIQTCVGGTKTTPKGYIQTAHNAIVDADPANHRGVPLYPYPVIGDGIHVFAIGRRLYGLAIGRTIEQIEAGFEPDALYCIAAWAIGRQIYVKFKVPRAPLVFDPIGMPRTQDMGFLLKDDTGTFVLSNLRMVAPDIVNMTADRDPAANLFVRYALDYAPQVATTLPTNGATGCLRDSTPDATMIQGVTYQIPHYCWAFEQPVVIRENFV